MGDLEIKLITDMNRLKLGGLVWNPSRAGAHGVPWQMPRLPPERAFCSF